MHPSTSRPGFLSALQQHTTLSILLPLAGALCITLASQVRIELGFTPVPITGQTFAVILWGMLFGSKQGTMAAAAYLVLGAFGLPVFAGFTALSALWGTTSGYLLGFIPGAWLAGWLQERTRSSNPLTLFAIALSAHIPILALGGVVMSAFFAFDQLWLLAIAPFLLGDIIKSAVIATVGASIWRLKRGT